MKALIEFKNDFNEIKNKSFIYKLPSIITSIRIICTLLIPLFLLLNRPNLSIIVAIIGSLSDAFDGNIARRYNVTSNFGAKLDALCDKIFICSLTICLIILSSNYIKLLFLIILLNELIISFINGKKVLKLIKTKTTQIGRIKMISICISLLIGFASILVSSLYIPTIIALIITIFLQIKTIISYKLQVIS